MVPVIIMLLVGRYVSYWMDEWLGFLWHFKHLIALNYFMPETV